MTTRFYRESRLPSLLMGHGMPVTDRSLHRSTVTPEMSADPAWWRDERYAIYDLNVNSAVVYPQHGEVLDVDLPGRDYVVRGYAYSGGGRRVTRVELSFDSGRCK